MSMMAEIHAAMTAGGVIGEYEWYSGKVAEMTVGIDALQRAPYASEAEYAEQMETLHQLRVLRRQARAHAGRLLDAYAGKVARSGQVAASAGA